MQVILKIENAIVNDFKKKFYSYKNNLEFSMLNKNKIVSLFAFL